ncbi:MAG: hypothetical protein ACJAVZ_004304 [Afipia broomeae]|jgi:hypothetical protein
MSREVKTGRVVRVVVQFVVNWIRIGTAEDHMNPRSSNDPSEGDSRRQSPAIDAPLGCIIARVGSADVTAPALRR